MSASLAARLARRLAFKEGLYRDRAMQAYARLRGRAPREQLYRMSPYWTKTPLLGRAGTTDWRVFHQVFVQGEYDFPDAGADVRSIVDCGANVGYTAAWFLGKYPGSRCLAIEPDPENFELLQINLSQFGNRVALRRAAVWSHDAPLRLVRDDAVGDWGVAVRECIAGEAPDVEGLSMATVLASAPPPGEVDVLKMDVEGAETPVLSAEPLSWLSRVGLFIVELHDDAAQAAFTAAMAGAPFDLTRRGEFVAARRRRS